MLHKIAGALAAAGAMLAGTAQAEISEADLRRVLTNKGMQYVQSQQGGNGTSVVLARFSDGLPVAFSMIDFNGNGRAEIMLTLIAIPNVAPPNFNAINNFNLSAASKAMIQNGSPTMVLPSVLMGQIDDATISGAIDIFRIEVAGFLGMVRSGGGNTFGTSVKVEDPYSIDKGMTRVEVSARDAALTAKLNQTGGHLATSVSMPSGHEALLESAFALSAAYIERN